MTPDWALLKARDEEIRRLRVALEVIAREDDAEFVEKFGADAEGVALESRRAIAQSALAAKPEAEGREGTDAGR